MRDEEQDAWGARLGSMDKSGDYKAAEKEGLRFGPEKTAPERQLPCGA
jgi:hypothetical protein